MCIKYTPRNTCLRPLYTPTDYGCISEFNGFTFSRRNSNFGGHLGCHTIICHSENFKNTYNLDIHTSMQFKQFALSNLLIIILFMKKKISLAAILDAMLKWLRCCIKTLLNCVHMLHSNIKLIPVTCDMLGNTLYGI